jgi:predicted RNase H-like HicB family nuclease
MASQAKVRKVNKHSYQIYLRPEPEGGFTVSVPALPGCITWGKDLAHARKMAADAIRAYIASLRKPSLQSKNRALSA